MSLERPISLAEWFARTLEPSRLRSDTKAYVVGVLTTMSVHDIQGGRQSIVIAYHEAKISGEFVRFQRLGDWALWARIWNPTSLHGEVVESVGRSSYDACYRLLGRSWPVYEELADDLPRIARCVRVSLP